MKNHWRNLFIDRSEMIASISDEEIKQWINEDNYSPFIEKLQADSEWQGEIAHIQNLAYPQQAFDELGFARDKSHWVAFNYKPFLSTFWPTNGSTGDVMIRLGAPFRELNGQYNQDVYIANLSLVEMAIKGLEQLSTPSISEQAIGVDLNGNNRLEKQIHAISKRSHYLGDAQDIELAYQLYPQDTEFCTPCVTLVDPQGRIYNAPRMKEVRYMRKHNFKSKARLASFYYSEAKEKHFEKLPRTRPLGDKGINNMFGWTINGYIEDEQGQLRHQDIRKWHFATAAIKPWERRLIKPFPFHAKSQGREGWGYINLASMHDAPTLVKPKASF